MMPSCAMSLRLRFGSRADLTPTAPTHRRRPPLPVCNLEYALKELSRQIAPARQLFSGFGVRGRRRWGQLWGQRRRRWRETSTPSTRGPEDTRVTKGNTSCETLLHRDASRLVRETRQPRRVVLDIRGSDNIPEVAPPEPRLQEVRFNFSAIPLIWRQRLQRHPAIRTPAQTVVVIIRRVVREEPP